MVETKAKPKQGKVIKVMFFVTSALLLISVIFSAVMMFLAPQSATGDMTKSDYALMLFQSVLGLIVLILPSVLEKKLSMDIPVFMEILIVLFVYAAIFLGEVRFFYHRFKYWDTILHTFSGVFIGLIGYSLINLLNSSNKTSMKLSPGFIALFAFCFSMTALCVWEIYEFAIDQFIGADMQKFLPPGLLVGEGLSDEQLLELGRFYNSREGHRFALMDTMIDLIVGFFGALLVSLIGYFSLKFKKKWFNRVLIITENPVDIVSVEDGENETEAELLQTVDTIQSQSVEIEEPKK